MPERAKALRADWAPGPGVFVLFETVKAVSQSASQHEMSAKVGHAFVTCCLRWLSVWYAALWFQALCSAEQHPEQPTWQHMEMTHLCLPSPSSLQSHGRWSPWHHKHTSKLIQILSQSITSYKVQLLKVWLAQRHRFHKDGASLLSSLKA